MIPPIYFVRHPGLTKAESLIAYIAQAGIREPAIVTAILFIADGEHLGLYGRGLYGETWHRCDPDPCQIVHGVLIDTMVERIRLPQRPLTFCRDAVSQSDLDQVGRALDLLRPFADRAEGRSVGDRIPILQEAFATVRTSRLWEDGPSGQPLDLLKPARDRLRQPDGSIDEDSLGDSYLMISHASYGSFLT
jgi:hypothetical protein